MQIQPAPSLGTLLQNCLASDESLPDILAHAATELRDVAVRAICSTVSGAIESAELLAWVTKDKTMPVLYEMSKHAAKFDVFQSAAGTNAASHAALQLPSEHTFPVLRNPMLAAMATLPEDASISDRVKPVIKQIADVGRFGLIVAAVPVVSIEAGTASAMKTLANVARNAEKELSIAPKTVYADGAVAVPLEDVQLNFARTGRFGSKPDFPLTAPQLSDMLERQTLRKNAKVSELQRIKEEIKARMASLQERQQAVEADLKQLSKDIQTTKRQLAARKPEVLQTIQRIEGELSTLRERRMGYQTKLQASKADLSESAVNRMDKLIRSADRRIDQAVSKLERLRSALAKIE